MFVIAENGNKHNRNGGFDHSLLRTGWQAMPVFEPMYWEWPVGHSLLGKGGNPMTIFYKNIESKSGKILLPATTTKFVGGIAIKPCRCCQNINTTARFLF